MQIFDLIHSFSFNISQYLPKHNHVLIHNTKQTNHHKYKEINNKKSITYIKKKDSTQQNQKGCDNYNPSLIQYTLSQYNIFK